VLERIAEVALSRAGCREVIGGAPLLVDQQKPDPARLGIAEIDVQPFHESEIVRDAEVFLQTTVGL